MCKLDWTSIAIVFATLAGPILAVWASEIRQRRRQDRDRKEWIFRTLWTTKSARLHPDHIQALNNIDFAFPQSKYPLIADAWGLYFAHLNTPRGETDDIRKIWSDTASNLFADLVHLMAKELDIPFSKTQVKQPSYYPELYALTEDQQNELRTLLLDVLKHGRPINIRTITDNPFDKGPNITK
jgi:hypothetical protein